MKSYDVVLVEHQLEDVQAEVARLKGLFSRVAGICRVWCEGGQDVWGAREGMQSVTDCVRAALEAKK